MSLLVRHANMLGGLGGLAWAEKALSEVTYSCSPAYCEYLSVFY